MSHGRHWADEGYYGGGGLPPAWNSKAAKVDDGNALNGVWPGASQQIAHWIEGSLVNPDSDQFESFCLLDNRITGVAEFTSEHWEEIGLNDEDALYCSVQFEGDSIPGYRQTHPLRHFLIALKRTGMPVVVQSGIGGQAFWVAWDSSIEKMVSLSPYTQRRVHGLFERISGLREWPGHEHPISDDLKLARFLEKAAASDDHGKKPIILKNDDYESLNCHPEVSFLSPQSLSLDESRNYVLAYYNAHGEFRSVSLSLAINLGLPIATRTGIYYRTKQGISLSIREEMLRVNSFLFAISASPIDMQVFRKISNGTLYQSAFHPAPISAMQWRPCFGEESSLDWARAIIKTTQSMGDVYLTMSCHPCEYASAHLTDCNTGYALVTRPQYYLEALHKLASSGIKVTFPDEDRGHSGKNINVVIVDDEE